MCDFPSWIAAEDGTVLFLTDGDVARLPETFHNETLPGHSAIRAVYPHAKGVEGERFPCPPEVMAAIRGGKMSRMARVAGHDRVLFPRDGETVSPQGGDLVFVEAGHVTVAGQSGGACRFYGNSTGTVSGQTGGYCWFYDNSTRKESL